FLPIETTGDGAVNVYSRVQMQLFKARQMAEREMGEQLQVIGWTPEEYRKRVLASKRLTSALHYSPHAGACTAQDLLADVRRSRHWFRRVGGALGGLWRGAGRHKRDTLDAVQRVASAYRDRQQHAGG